MSSAAGDSALTHTSLRANATSEPAAASSALVAVEELKDDAHLLSRYPELGMLIRHREKKKKEETEAASSSAPITEWQKQLDVPQRITRTMELPEVKRLLNIALGRVTRWKRANPEPTASLFSGAGKEDEDVTAPGAVVNGEEFMASGIGAIGTRGARSRGIGSTEVESRVSNEVCDLVFAHRCGVLAALMGSELGVSIPADEPTDKLNESVVPFQIWHDTPLEDAKCIMAAALDRVKEWVKNNPPSSTIVDNHGCASAASRTASGDGIIVTGEGGLAVGVGALGSSGSKARGVGSLETGMKRSRDELVPLIGDHHRAVMAALRSKTLPVGSSAAAASDRFPGEEPSAKRSKKEGSKKGGDFTIVIDRKLKPEHYDDGDELTEVGKSGPRVPGDLSYEVKHLQGVTKVNGLIHGLHTAFACHLTFELRPDVLWFTILQQLAIHIKLNPDKHRAKLVKHAEGKKEVEVRNDAVLRNKEAWADVFLGSKQDVGFRARLVELCAENSSTKAIFDMKFETKDAVADIANAVVIMDVMESYFSYVVRSMCGIPRVVLKESKESWRNLLDAVENLDLHKTFGVDKEWTIRLWEALELIEGNHGMESYDPSHWKDIYKYNASKGSGSDHVSGWIRNFFYYDSQGKPMGKYPVVCNFPNSMSAVPFVWKVDGQKDQPMTFYAGVDDAVVKGNTVSNEFGWAVAHRGEESK